MSQQYFEQMQRLQQLELQMLQGLDAPLSPQPGNKEELEHMQRLVPSSLRCDLWAFRLCTANSQSRMMSRGGTAGERRHLPNNQKRKEMNERVRLINNLYHLLKVFFVGFSSNVDHLV